MYFNKKEIKLPPESVTKVREFQNAGHLFGLCTGRPVGGVTPFIKNAIRPDFYICSSGSDIVDSELAEIRKRTIDREVAEAICRRYLSDTTEGDRIMVCVDDQFYVFHETDMPVELHVLGGVEDIPEGMLYQVSIHADKPEAAAAIAAYINETFGDKVAAFQNVEDVDIAPVGCSKGHGMDLLRRHFGERHGEVKLYGIGDSYNDLPLMEAADVSYTFPYAPKEVQEKATKVVETIVDALEDCMRDEE